MDDLLKEVSEQEKRQRIESGLEDVQAGRTVPHAEVKAWAQRLLDDAQRLRIGNADLRTEKSDPGCGPA